MKEVEECFKTAIKDEEKGRKHKGLLFTTPNSEKAKEYLNKAKINLRLCDLYKERGIDYKIPEEWFYTFYYCALSILAKFGVESRSQKCTALFLKFVKDKNLIDYGNEFIDRITVYRDKEKTSNVDEREKARYSSSIKNEEIVSEYEFMKNLCKKIFSCSEKIFRVVYKCGSFQEHLYFIHHKKAIFQCEELIFSDKKLEIPEEIKRLLT